MHGAGRLDSLGRAGYGFDPDRAVRAKARDISVLSLVGKEDGL